MATLAFPSVAMLREIEQDLRSVVSENDPIFSLMPVVNEDADKVIWEQKDNYIGLQNIRPINSQFTRVARVGAKRYELSPGLYGDYMEIDETQLTRKRQLGSFDSPIIAEKEVNELFEQLIVREMSRIAMVCWNALQGSISVADATGAVLLSDTFAVQSVSISTAWSDYSNAVPIRNFEAAVLKHRGYGVDFSKGKAYMNLATFQDLVRNANAADLGGRYINAGNTVNDVTALNQLFKGRSLPEVIPHDGGYFDNSGTWTPFIPYKSIIIVGERYDGNQIGQYVMTRNGSNPGMGPGSYTRILDSAETGGPAPRTIRVEKGHNGAPAIWYPASICVMSWT